MKSSSNTEDTSLDSHLSALWVLGSILYATIGYLDLNSTRELIY